jgi:uncharacterized protein with HEPN domain
LPSRKPRDRLGDILDNIGWIQSDIRDLGEEQFVADRRAQDAVLYCLLRITEAAAKLEDQAETLAPDQPWAKIRSLGNLLRHAYDEIDLHVIWRIVRDDLPALGKACERALAQLPER